MASGMSLVHVHGHQNSGRLASTLTPLSSLNVRLDALAKHIMEGFLLSSATTNTRDIGLLDLHGIPSVPIHGDPVHSNIDQSIEYEISKRWILRHWDDRNLTHTADWDEVDFTSFKRALETTTVHMSLLNINIYM